MLVVVVGGKRGKGDYKEALWSFADCDCIIVTVICYDCEIYQKDTLLLV